MRFVIFIIFIFRVLFKFFFTIVIKFLCKSYVSPLTVNGFSVVTNNTILGKNVNFNGMKISGNGNVSIGDNFHSGKNCSIMTQNHNFDNGIQIPYDSSYICLDTFIGDNVWFGDNVLILAGVNIGEGVVVQAGSVVVSDIPNYAIAGGHPAKVFKYRNISHYVELKKLKRFH